MLRQTHRVNTMVEELLDAMRRGDAEAARLLLHPYLHWEREDGTVVRGRRNVLALLEAAPDPEPPASVELRDGQIYRWMR